VATCRPKNKKPRNGIRSGAQLSTHFVPALLADAEQFDLERQIGIRRNGADATVAISGCRRACEFGLTAYFHFLDALRPARLVYFGQTRKPSVFSAQIFKTALQSKYIKAEANLLRLSKRVIQPKT
jgi:hypothetical protein